MSVKERKYVPFLITPCSKWDKDERKKTFGGVKFSHVETEEALNNSLCPTLIKEDSFLSIQGIIHRNKSMTAKLYVYPCDEKNPICKARKRDETLSLLTNLKINIGFITPDFDLGNFHRPIGFSLDYSRYYFKKDILTTEVDLMVGKTLISDDLGPPLISSNNWTKVISVESENERSISRLNTSVSCNYSETSIGCTHYFRMTMYSGVTEREIKRKYKGLAEVLGTVGGNKEIILLIFAVIFKILYGRQQKLRIVKYVYGLEPDVKNSG